jgi:hypothetical protein
VEDSRAESETGEGGDDSVATSVEPGGRPMLLHAEPLPHAASSRAASPAAAARREPRRHHLVATHDRHRAT